MAADAHEILRGARDLIVRDGWCQHFSGQIKRGPYCAEGAIAHAAGITTYKETCEFIHGAAGSDEAKRARDALAESVGNIPWLWNDAPGRTVEEVLAAFDEAIASTAPEPSIGTEILEVEALLSDTAERFAAILAKSGVGVAEESMRSVAYFELTSAAEDAAAMICGTVTGAEASFQARSEWMGFGRES